MFLNGPPTAFWLAHLGLARICAAPPEQSPPKNADEASWQQWGTILFWSQKPEIPQSTMRSRCEPAWRRLSSDLLRGAVDPLFQIERYGGSWTRGIQFTSLADLFPRELKSLIDASLPLALHLTSINSRAHRLEERIDFMIAKLTTVGDEFSLAVLEPLCESPTHGRAAVRAVKAIQARILSSSRGKEAKRARSV